MGAQDFAGIDEIKAVAIAGITKEWGWTDPPEEILKVAEKALTAKVTKSADFLEMQGYLTKEDKERFLASKPSNIKTIAWIGQQDSVDIPMDGMMALKCGYPFYENLSLFTGHDCMKSSDVSKRADELDAMVLSIEDSVPVIVFSQFSTMISFASMGRQEKQADCILRSLEQHQYRLAVSTREEINILTMAFRNADDDGGSQVSANVWRADSVETRSKDDEREISRIIDHALKVKATDIAFRPYRSGELQVLVRRFQKLVPPKAGSPRISSELAFRVINMLQAKSGANPDKTQLRVPSDGQITYISGAGKAFLRLSFIPLNHLGEIRNIQSLSIRVFSTAQTSINFNELALHPKVVEQIRFAMKMSQGMVLIVGPTNSGKSTTAAGCIDAHVQLFGDSQKRISVEDPIERFLYGITQINPVASKAIKGEGEKFNIILRAIKRHDPDFINIGEIRDKETATLAVDSASTGHLVMSTTHANDTILGYISLANSVPVEKRFTLVESMSMVISQRLVSTLCPHCRIVSDVTEDDQAQFDQYLERIGEEGKLPAKIARHNPRGCTHCNEEGFIGMAPITEVLPFTRKVKDAALAMLAGENTRHQIAAARTMTLLQNALILLGDHTITLDDVLV